MNYYPEDNNCTPIEEIYIGSMCVKPKWALGGKLLIDGGALAKDKKPIILRQL